MSKLMKPIKVMYVFNNDHLARVYSTVQSWLSKKEKDCTKCLKTDFPDRKWANKTFPHIKLFPKSERTDAEENFGKFNSNS